MSSVSSLLSPTLEYAGHGLVDDIVGSLVVAEQQVCAANLGIELGSIKGAELDIRRIHRLHAFRSHGVFNARTPQIDTHEVVSRRTTGVGGRRETRR